MDIGSWQISLRELLLIEMASQDSTQEEDSSDKATPNGVLSRENTCVCQVCFVDKPRDSFVTFSSCGHSFCSECVRYAFQYKVSETRVKLQCLQCSAAVTQEELDHICDGELYQKYPQCTLLSCPRLSLCLYRHINTSPVWCSGATLCLPSRGVWEGVL